MRRVSYMQVQFTLAILDHEPVHLCLGINPWKIINDDAPRYVSNLTVADDLDVYIAPPYFTYRGILTVSKMEASHANAFL